MADNDTPLAVRTVRGPYLISEYTDMQETVNANRLGRLQGVFSQGSFYYNETNNLIWSAEIRIYFHNIASDVIILNTVAASNVGCGDYNVFWVRRSQTDLQALPMQVSTYTDFERATALGNQSGDVVIIGYTDNTYFHPAHAGLSVVTSAEKNELRNINSVTIDNTQWGYLGALTESPQTHMGDTNNPHSVAFGDVDTGTDFNSHAEQVKAGMTIHGGGVITVASWRVGWDDSFKLISQGYGSHFSTGGQFNINQPTSGTITAVGGGTANTWNSSGIVLTGWDALYYILPIGTGGASIDANFRMVGYTSALEVPDDWLFIAGRNGGSSPHIRFGVGIILLNGETWTQGTSSMIGGHGTGVVTDHSDVSSAGSGIIITNAERAALHTEVTRATLGLATSDSPTFANLYTGLLYSRIDSDHYINLDAAADEIHIHPGDDSIDNYLIIASTNDGWESPRISPSTNGEGKIGDNRTVRMWDSIYVETIWNTYQYALDYLDDLALIEAMSVEKDEQGEMVRDQHIRGFNLPVLDKETLPDFLFEPPERHGQKNEDGSPKTKVGTINLGMMTALVRGGVKQLSIRERGNNETVIAAIDQIGTLLTDIEARLTALENT